MLLLAVLAVAIDAAVTHGLRKITTSKFGAFNRVVDGRVDADILISGSSRALSHYDPRIIEAVTGCSAFNVGMNASQIDFELAVLRTYLKHNRPPKVLVQNLDLFSFEVTQKGFIYDPGYYIPYLDEDVLYSFLHGIDPNVWKWKYIPLYGYAVPDMRFTWMMGLLGCLGVNGREDYFAGFNPRNQTWNEDFARFRAAVGDRGVRYQIMPEGLKAMREILETCRSRGIAVILVYSPEYFEMQALEVNRKEVMATIRNLATEYKVPFWDYSDSAICRDRTLFSNSQHLNASGAELFSRDVATRLSMTPLLTGAGAMLHGPVPNTAKLQDVR